MNLNTQLEQTDVIYAQTQTADTPLGPGQRLSEARHRLGLSVSAVAKRLSLDKHFIEALERDDYSDMPANVFIRGYIRGYAGIVNLPADALIESFNALKLPEQRSNRRVTFIQNDISSGPRHGGQRRWLTLLGLGVILFTLWLFAQKNDNVGDLNTVALPEMTEVRD